MAISNIVRDAIEIFCTEFLQDPYLCYTEHGQHARFYSLLYGMLPVSRRYINVGPYKVCIVQKEYPTAGTLDKPRRQHWDIAVLDPEIESAEQDSLRYDYLKLNSVVEFGLNEGIEHLQDDINRLTHIDANVTNKFIVHLYRISGEGMTRFSDRDWSPKSKQLVIPQDVYSLVKDNDVEVFFGVYDSTGTHKNGLWNIKSSGIIKI